jgi:AcrR family transcriptional regulator
LASPRPLRELAREDPRSPTKERLLRAAESLIAEQGVEAFSIRAVTRAAGVSVSAANYHFGSKEALVQETLWRVLAPMNDRRLERLDALEAEAGDGDPPRVEVLIDAFLRPAFDLESEEAPGVYRRFAAQLHSGPPEFEGRMKVELLNPSFQRFVDALARALPDRDRTDLALAFQFSLGAALHVLRGHAERLADAEGLPDEEVFRRLVRFAAEGICASCPRGEGAP